MTRTKKAKGTIATTGTFKAMRIAGALGLAVSLSGCLVALPPALQVASLALDGLSYISTGKSVSDHALSAVAQKDCAILRALDDINGICTENINNMDLDISVANGNSHINSVRRAEMKQLSEAWLTEDFDSWASGNSDQKISRFK